MKKEKAGQGSGKENLIGRQEWKEGLPRKSLTQVKKGRGQKKGKEEAIEVNEKRSIGPIYQEKKNKGEVKEEKRS